MKKIILLLFILSVSIYAQQQDPYKLLDRVKQKFSSSVDDYQVNAHIKVDVSFIKVPEMDAKVYFKKPDKMKMDTEGFAMLPKQAFSFSPDLLFQGKYNAIYVRQDKLDNTPVHVIKVIPDDEKSDIVLSTIWIDPGKEVIRKIASTGRKGGSFEISFNYDANMHYPLPSSIQFSFEAPNSPRGMHGPGSDNQQNRQGTKNGQSEKGRVSITYSNYKINKGISDSFFAEKKK